ncbi:hypothetical protein [Pseudonocardia alaniniphila]|uniref:Cytochrome c oxidase assembly protein subunit 15 n=1 Tax=Pseudonocardia alaniniphila TaxID=75291 RepID=A0ABS9TCB3_9PSEU|nr:hypothetical protein [Pseudonocardia alaniniphila]MCH6166142.1 hypothetical protein [Pseudonocardia alaniniphila]
MRTVYRVLAYVIALEVLVQGAMITFAVFGLRHWIDEGGVLDETIVQNHAEGFGEVVGFRLHATNEQVIVPAIAVLLLISAFCAKVPKAVMWAVIVLLSVVVQVLLGLFALDAPALGILHGINGILLFAFALVAARSADVSGAGPLRASRDAADLGRSGVIRSTR